MQIYKLLNQPRKWGNSFRESISLGQRYPRAEIQFLFNKFSISVRMPYLQEIENGIQSGLKIITIIGVRHTRFSWGGTASVMGTLEYQWLLKGPSIFLSVFFAVLSILALPSTPLKVIIWPHSQIGQAQQGCFLSRISFVTSIKPIPRAVPLSVDLVLEDPLLNEQVSKVALANYSGAFPAWTGLVRLVNGLFCETLYCIP